ncbi:MAG: hypothetical protein QN229_02705 [Desulfurococcaceae archaeon TW002]
MDVFEFIATYVVLGSLVGVMVYLVFYYLFQKFIASATPEERNTVSDLPVMGGFIYDELPTQSVTQMLRDIFRRALGPSRLREVIRLYKFVDMWYILALFVLLLMIAIFLLIR